MLADRLQSLFIGWCALILATVWVQVANAQTTGGARKPLTTVVTRNELGESIDSWTKIQSEALQAAFRRDVTVKVENDAAAFLVKQYMDRSIPSNLLEDRELARFVIKMDLFTVLKRSFEENVRSKYETLFHFLQSKSSEILINVRDIQVALKDEDCRIIT